MALQNENTIINALWIGSRLSNIELLTIHSFLKNGHIFVLWVYDEIENKIPEGLVIKDASEIIPRNKVFCYKNTNQFGHGKGSYAGFSDIFRYKLLYENGGWWVDMDVTCLKPFEFKDPYVFRTHHDFPVVGNIMKCPKGSELMRLCYNEASIQMDENNANWNLPMQILNGNIKKLGLGEYIRTLCNKDSWNVLRKMLVKRTEIPDEWYAIHWVNEEWRRNNVDKIYFCRNSTIGMLCSKYMPLNNTVLVDFSFFRRMKFSFAHSAFMQIITRLFR